MTTLERTAAGFARSYASVPMLRSAYRVRSSRSPWLSIDPVLQAEMSNAVRAVRLMLLALFALFLSPAKSLASASDEASEIELLKRKIDAQQKQIDELKASIAGKHGAMNQAQAEPTRTDAIETTTTGQTLKAVSDPKRDDPRLEVKRDHAPPQQTFRFNGLLQAWFTSGTTNRDSFRLRRTELKFGGDITPKLKWTLMFDPAKLLSVNTVSTLSPTGTVTSTSTVNQASRGLQDAFISYDHNRSVGVDVGQFKLPLSMEGPQGSGALDTVERALFLSDRARGGALGDVRDTGLQLRAKAGSTLQAFAAVANGLGETQNALDVDEGKALIGRMVLTPKGERGLQLGASGAWSTDNAPPGGRRNRLGAEAQLRLAKLTIKSELMSGNDLGIARLGGYAHLGVRVRNVEPVLRFEYWDPDVSTEASPASVVERDFLGGMNIYFREHNAKLQLNYVRKTFTREISPNRNLLLVNLQTSW